MFNTQQQDEHQVILRLRQGDEHAFTKIYSEYSRKLYLHVLKVAKDRDVAEGLLQEIFIKVWDNRTTFDPSQSFQAWLYTVARNSVYSHFRQLAKEQKLQEQLYSQFEELYDMEMEGDLKDKQLELLTRALASLSDRRKEIFELCKIQGKSYQEVAAMLGLSSSTVSNLMVKSNQQIRKFIQQHYDEILLFIIAYTIK